MTEEQEKAIGFLEKRIEICIENANICDENDFDEEASQLREEQKHTETVLNIIQQLQEEKEKYKELYNKALSDLVIDEKIINEMAKYIRVEDIEEFDDIDLCDFLNKSYDDCRHLSIACEECIKQYFKKKANKQIQ